MNKSLVSKGNLNRRNRIQSQEPGQDKVDMEICKHGGCACERGEGMDTHGGQRECEGWSS